MGLQPATAAFFDKIESAIRKAQDNLIAQRAQNNETVVLNVNGKPENVPAKDLISQANTIKVKR
jgi:hypothetical protein